MQRGNNRIKDVVYMQNVMTWGGSGKGHIVPPDITGEERMRRMELVSAVATDICERVARSRVENRGKGRAR